MVKRAAHQAAFDTLFDLYFGDPGTGVDGDSEDVQPERENLRAELFDALLTGDAGAASGIVVQAVMGFGRLERTPDWYSNYEVTRALGLDEMSTRLAEHADDETLTDP